MDPKYVLEQVHQVVNDFMHSDNPRYEIAAIMVAGLFVGPNVDAIVRLTGSRRELVETIASRFRACGMWTDEGVDYDDWFAADGGLIRFAIELSVAEGTFIRTEKSKDGVWIYKLVGWKVN
jgi:hypothetical protein